MGMEGSPGGVPEVVPLGSTAPPGEGCCRFGGGAEGPPQGLCGSGGLTAGKWDGPLLYHQRGHRTAALKHGHHLVMGAVPAEQRWPGRAWQG